MIISQAASSEFARSARAYVRRSSRRQSLSLQTPVGAGVIPFSTDSGIKRYGCLAPLLRLRARRGGDTRLDRAQARVRNSEMQERRRDALQVERIAEESEGLTARAQPHARVQACKFASPYRP